MKKPKHNCNKIIFQIHINHQIKLRKLIIFFFSKLECKHFVWANLEQRHLWIMDFFFYGKHNKKGETFVRKFTSKMKENNLIIHTFRQPNNLKKTCKLHSYTIMSFLHFKFRFNLRTI